MHNWPADYDIVKVDGMIPDWVDDGAAYFGSCDDYYKIDLTDPAVLIQFFKLVEIT